MSEILVNDSIQTDENNPAIITDEQTKPLKGEKGDKGDKGRDGRDGLDGKNGLDGKDGRDGIDGRNGLDGRDGVDGKNGRDGLNGRDGQDGKDGLDGRDGTDGKDGTEWHFFQAKLDESVGLLGDFALIQSTSDYYRKEIKSGELLWVFKGKLKGKDGENGRDGRDGLSGGGGGGSETGTGLQHTFICADIYDDGTNFLVSNTCRLYDQSVLDAQLELINLVESA